MLVNSPIAVVPQVTGAALNAVLFDIDVTNYEVVSVQITGTYVATVAYEMSNNRTDWIAVAGLDVANLGTSGLVTTTTNNGIRMFPTKGCFFRARISAFTSGSVVANAVASQKSIDLRTVFATLAAIPAGTNLIGDVGVQYRTTGGATIHRVQAAAGTNSAIVKASAGKVLGWNFSNLVAAWRFVKLCNITTAPVVGTTAVFLVIPIPPNGDVEFFAEGGIPFSTGIGRYVVTGVADTDATATAANDVVGQIYFV